MTIAQDNSPTHRSEPLDGLRGIAILLVMLFHMAVMNPTAEIDRFALKVLSAGWIGVELFFVLSGFLITSILLRTRGTAGYFRNFWARRALRIFPLYYAILLFCLVALPLIPNPKAASFARISGDEIWYVLYLQNFSIAAANAFRHGILDVTWSLAIEEQFYLIWPFVVALAGPRKLVPVCIGLIAVSLVFRAILLMEDASSIAVYVLTPGRWDGLAVGALLAAATANGDRALIDAFKTHVLWLALVLLCGAALYAGELTWESRLIQVAGFPLLACVFGGFVANAIDERKLHAWWMPFLRSKPLRAFGKYSYAMYLFHLPLRAVVRDKVYTPSDFLVIGGSSLPGQVIFFGLALGLTFACAWLSWHLFESRFLRMKDRFRSEPLPVSDQGQRLTQT